MKSRVTGDCHARFRENVGVKFPCVTRLADILTNLTTPKQTRMDNRVYYGEYSLKHWIDLILKQNIILPDYQRHFVWDEKKVETLIDTFKNKQFVPPVTIGSFNLNGSNQNLILDGQQRLTSILLAYLGLYPDEATYKEAIK